MAIAPGFVDPMLSDICNVFQTEIESLNEADDLDYAVELKRLVLNLAKDAASHVTDYHYGEIPALLQRCHEVLAWVRSEVEDPVDRQRRHRRRQAVLNLLVLCEGVCRFHAPGKRKAAEVTAFSNLIADALRALVPSET